MNKYIKNIYTIGIIAIIFISGIWVRAYIGSIQDYNKGDKFFNKQDYIKAITFFDRSLQWYTPFNPYINKSAERLWDISKEAGKKGDVRLSLMALETIKNGFYSSRSFYSPGKHYINRCQKKLNEIVQGQQKEQATQSSEYANMTIIKPVFEYNDPNIFWTLILEIGLLGWIGSGFRFILLINKKDRPKNIFYSYGFWALLVGFNYFLFVIGMIEA